jgi:hypothetical protein
MEAAHLRFEQYLKRHFGPTSTLRGHLESLVELVNWRDEQKTIHERLK